MKSPKDFIHEHLKQTLYSFIVLFVIALSLGVYFEAEVFKAANSIYEHIGIWGIGLFVFINDAILSPLPGDVGILVASKTPLAEHWFWVSTAFGLISALAGLAGHSIGKRLSDSQWLRSWLGEELNKMEAKFKRYGALLVIIGALTPVPFSMTTWVAGMMHFPRSKMVLLSLLRVPRFWVVYLLLVKTSTLSHFINSFFS